MGLGSKKCIQLEDGCEPLSEQNYERLRQQVPGWRVIKTGDSVSIRQDFKCQVRCYVVSTLLMCWLVVPATLLLQSFGRVEVTDCLYSVHFLACFETHLGQARREQVDREG